MNPLVSQPQERLLRPVARHFDKDGSPVIPLSPTRSIRNANVIYEKIKNLPDNTPLRADYDRGGKPFLYLPRLKKNSIQPARAPLQMANEQADRQEALNIMQAIAEEVQSLASASKEARLAAMRFGLAMRSRSVLGELRVGDVRQALAEITGADRTQAVGDAAPRRGNAFRTHLLNFVGMPDYLKQVFGNALETGHTSGNHKQSAAVEAMFTMISQYLAQHPVGQGREFIAFVERYPLSNDLIKFARQWMSLRAAKQTTAGFLFRQMPWAKEINFAARIIKYLCKRNQCWSSPGKMPRSPAALPASPIGSVAASVQAYRSPTQTSIRVPDAAPNPSAPNPSASLASRSKKALLSDQEVRSTPVATNSPRVSLAKRILYARHVLSDVLVGSVSDDTSGFGETSQTRADPAASDTMVSETEDSMKSLLDNIEWVAMPGAAEADQSADSHS